VTVSDGTASCTATVAAGQCNLTSTTAGSKTVTATYAGDDNFNDSTSAGVSHQVDKANTTTTITSDLSSPTVVGEAYTVAFSVSVNSPGSGTPTGNVTVSDGTASCTATVAAGQCNLTSTTAGSKTVTATYAGDDNFNGSSNTEGHEVSYAICVLYDQFKSHKKGSTVPIKLQLCDFSRNNLSSASIIVHATDLKKWDSSAISTVEDSGNANPDSDFRYDPTLGITGGYIFNLSTKSLSSGTWKLFFTAGSSSTSNSVQFDIK
jgi:hypothetical protein